MNTHLIFVYGTLKSGHCRNHYLKGQRLVGAFTTSPNYCLYKNYYPCMKQVKEGGKQIQGEVWEVDDKCLNRMDMMEGHPSLYCRTPITVSNPEEVQNRKVESYLFQGSVENATANGTNWELLPNEH